MLLREEPDGSVLTITQPAHAALAGRIAEAWDDALKPDLVVAARHHDDVWLDWDARPRLNPATGRPQTFLELADADRAAVWSRAAQVAEPLGPEAELWVLRHAERLHVDYEDPEINGMVAGFGARIAELAAQLRAVGPRFDEAELARGTSLIGLFDTLALTACFGVRRPSSAGVLSLTPAESGAIQVAPWPFSGDRLESYVEARRLPGRVGSQAELDALWSAPATAVAVTFVAPG